MKKILILFTVMIASTSFAQDMSASENASQAYRQLKDGSSLYVGKCKTHEDQLGKYFYVSQVIQERTESDQFTDKTVKAIADKVGVIAFRIMMKSFFDDLVDMSTTVSMLHDFQEYADDITIERIHLLSGNHLELIRFSVGYGGGNGGYLVLLKTPYGFEKMSLTNDGDLEFCDLKVWK